MEGKSVLDKHAQKMKSSEDYKPMGHFLQINDRKCVAELEITD